MIEFLNKLVDAGKFGILMMLIVLAGFAIVIASFLLYKLIQTGFHYKKGDTDVGIGGNKKGNASTAQVQIKAVDVQTFTSVVEQIVAYSIESGQQRSVKRQQLYDTQVRYIHDRLEGLKTTILYEYSNVPGHVQPVANAIFSLCLRNTIVEKLERICRADKLLEREKTQLIEENRSLIDNAAMSLTIELKKYITMSESSKANLTLEVAAIDESLLSIIEKKRSDVSKAITDCLEHSWDEAKVYFDELTELTEQLNASVTNALKSHFDLSQHNMIPTNWYSSDKLPPNEVAGASL